MREFRNVGGYVYEIFDGARSQVSEELFHSGVMMSAKRDLPSAIRSAAKACLRSEDKDEDSFR